MAESWYVRKATQHFSRYAIPLRDYFQDIKSDLKKANIPYDLTAYLSTALLTAVLAFIISAPLASVLVGLAFKSIAGLIAGLIVGLFVGLFLSVAIFMGFYLYPSIQVSQRKQNIEHNLPFATMYLSTVAGTGTPPSAMFKLLGDFEEYGEVSTEASKIARDVYTFGSDLDGAIVSAAKRTPSEKFKELLWGMHSVITAGGDLKSFLQQKTDAYMRDYRRELDKFTDTLSLLVEMYITLVIVGSVFLMIVSTIISAFGGSAITAFSLQLGTVVFILPLAAIMFIVLIKGTSPLEE